MNIAQESFGFSGLFEAELLLELMLRYWEHPLADDAEFRNDLIERASEGLRLATEGEQIVDGLAAQQTNFIAAVWYAETLAMAQTSSKEDASAARQQWCDRIRRALPSCFGDPKDLV